MKKLVLFCLFLCLYAQAQAWNIPVENFYPKAYHGGTQNWQIKQQRNGWMYFANNYGLLEYDGKQWNLYGIWNSSVIRSIEIVSEDSLIYVGGTNEFGYFKPNNQGGLTYRPLSNQLPEEYRNFGEAWNLIYLNNCLYVQTNNYIFCIPDNETVSVINPNAHIYHTTRIRNALFMATSEGVYLLTGTQLTAIRGSELLKGKAVRAMREYTPGSVLIATEFDGLFLFDSEMIRPFGTEVDNELKTYQLFDMAVSEHYLAFGTVQNGLVITDREGKNASFINSSNGLQNNTILCMEFDREGNLWLGLDQGIDHVQLNSAVKYLYSNAQSCGAGYCSIIFNNKLYLGTNQGLFVSNPASLKSGLSSKPQAVPGSSGQVWNLESIGNTLFCCHNRGLFEVNEHGVKCLISDQGIWRVRALHTHPNLALAGSYNGFYLLKKTTEGWKNAGFIKGHNTYSRIFEIDDNDLVWLITEKGIEQFSLKEQQDSCVKVFVKPYGDNKYFSILRYGKQIVVSGDHENQLAGLNGQLHDSAAFFAQLDGNKLYSCLQKGEDGSIWFITGTALKVRHYNSNALQYDNRLVEIWNQPNLHIGGFEHLMILNDHQALVSCTAGFALGDLTQTINNTKRVSTAPCIRRMLSTNGRDSLLYGESYPKLENNIKIDYSNNSLRFVMDGFTTDGEDLMYAYRLSPLEAEYGQWTKSHYKEYTHLREGKYTLWVRTNASNSGKYEECALSFTVRPPWYRTWWAYLIYCIPVALLLFAAVYILRERMEKGKRKVEEAKNKEIHDQEQRFTEEAHAREKEILKLQNEQTAMELKTKSQELANIMLSRVNKNEILSDIKNEIKRVMGDLHSGETDAASRKLVLLQSKISQNIEQEVDWNRFEENFDVVHAHFIQKLSEQYPMLSKKEKKLCIYIKMGLMTKEIAPLMNMSVRGVEMLRFRMRKRMELDRGDDLEQLFERI